MDPEANILRTIEWMNTCNFAEDQGVQRFPLTLAGEARLWYQSIHPFQGNWEKLQERFRTQFSQVGNTWGQMYDAWRTFHLDENADN